MMMASRGGIMKTLFLTNEYPPYIYGGAGVHVDYLSRALAKLCAVEVRCFGDQKRTSGLLKVLGFKGGTENFTAHPPLHSALKAIQRCVDFNVHHIDADIVHVHTWYAHFGGILAKLTRSIPLVLTVHSLEPLRPWKREQLAGGYELSTWVEKTALEMADAVIAVSRDTKADILRHFNVPANRIHIIHNGIDLREYRPLRNESRIRSLGINPEKPFILFVGRITRQKGILHLVRAIEHMDPGFQIVLCAGAPDTKEIEKEMQASVAAMQKKREGIIWIREMLDTPAKIALYTHADVFCCPSVYEPFGIINLEAMACETAVVATGVGGIKEVVVDGETGFLVPFQAKKQHPDEPLNPKAFEKTIAQRINRLMRDPELRKRMGKQGRRRAIALFSWDACAKKTYYLYKTLLKKTKTRNAKNR